MICKFGNYDTSIIFTQNRDGGVSYLDLPDHNYYKEVVFTSDFISIL